MNNIEWINLINSINVEISNLQNGKNAPRIYPFYKNKMVTFIDVMALDCDLFNYLHDIDYVPSELLNEISTIEKCQMVYGRKIAQRINKEFNSDGVLGVLTVNSGGCPTS
jgi:hypothetical protein